MCNGQHSSLPAKWYKVNVEALEPEAAELFLQLDWADAETQVFLERCQERSDAVFTQLFHLVARTLLAPFVSQTSINGILRRGSMFVISDRQFRRLFHLADDYRAERMLDLGAGDGATTALLSGMFDNVHVTEMSWPMKRILAARGFAVEDVEGWNQRRDGYDVICALNLLDRCSRPLTLLEQMRGALKPNGLVLVALAWPFRPYVEFSSNGDHQPEQVLDVRGQSLEDQATSMMDNVLKPVGFRVVSWSRLPYLCEGDLERTFYHLNDMIFALKSSD
ncbi:protein-L-histidine N-pros-methyltransferase-like isoform X2 [Daphnia pulex]|uniref:protein-L-histidine N-pros-methyltransferase-like isoform X2 n=1 Tax=Daphnia pulex TaxID=6669 RepID=UPI001EDE2B9B|nr:protein-L-histidine N-pros-methyltransferase-like isoform X2 [Daphnia pulex]